MLGLNSPTYRVSLSDMVVVVDVERTQLQDCRKTMLAG